MVGVSSPGSHPDFLLWFCFSRFAHSTSVTIHIMFAQHNACRRLVWLIESAYEPCISNTCLSKGYSLL